MGPSEPSRRGPRGWPADQTVETGYAGMSWTIPTHGKSPDV